MLVRLGLTALNELVKRLIKESQLQAKNTQFVCDLARLV